MARLSSELVLSLTDRVSGPARGVERSVDRLYDSTRRRAASITSSYGAMAAGPMMLANAAGVAGIAGGAGAALVARETVRAAADFEQALVNIRKKSGATAPEVERLGEEIKDLATDGKLAMSIDEIAAAYERGGAAGIPLADLREFASLSAQAADAFEMSATDVGNAAAGFNTALGVPMERMRGLFDLINGLADSGISDERDIVDFLDSAGAMGKTFGLTVQQTAALGAALVNLKVPAGQAATAVNSILTKLLAPNALSARGRGAFKRLVGDVDEFATLLEKDADGALVKVVESLKELDRSSRTEIIAELFGQEHLDVMSQLVEGSDELVRNLRYAEGTDWHGSLGKSYDLKLDTFWAQWEIVRNALRRLAIDTGTMGMPAFRAALETALETVGEVDRSLKHFRAEIDMSEIGRARDAVTTLSASISDLFGMGGSSDQGAIMAWFERLAGTVNAISGGINIVKDGAQALGLVAPDDDTPEQRAQRRTDFIDDYARFNPYLGGAMQNGRDWWNSERVENAQLENSEMGSRARQRDASIRSSQIMSADDIALQDSIAAHREARTRAIAAITGDEPSASSRGERVGPSPSDRLDPVPLPQIDGLQGSVDALTAALARRAAVEPPRATPTPHSIGAPVAAVDVPIPSPRPDIDGPVRQEGERAAASAEGIGQRISDAFSVTASPVIDTTSIDNAAASIARLRRELNSINGEIRAAGARTQRSAERWQPNGIFADIEP